MRMSVREARAQFAHALSAAERGERVTITKNGKPIAEIGPPSAVPDEDETEKNFWERMARVRMELGLDKLKPPRPLNEDWRRDFDDSSETYSMFGIDADASEDRER